MLYIGIDVGQKGALSVIDKNGMVNTSIPFNLRGYIDYLQVHRDIKIPCIVGIEKVHAMPKQGVKSMFSFGQRLGEIEGMLQTLRLPYELVPPRVWQRECSIKPKSTKKDIAEQILKLYPNAQVRGRRGGLLDGISDSIGIAHYIRIKYGGNI